MTAAQLRYNILIGVDSLYAGTAPGYNDTQMSAIINRAQRRVFRNYAKNFDTDEKVKRILAPLLKRASVTDGDISATVDTTITDYKHIASTLASTFYTLPSDVAYIKEESAILTTDPVIVLPITYDYFNKNYKNRYKKPHTELIWRMDAKLDSGSHVVEIIYPSTSTLSDYTITYLKFPTNIVVDTVAPIAETPCEIPDQGFQDEIISESVKIIVAALNDEGYQVASLEKNFDEN